MWYKRMKRVFVIESGKRKYEWHSRELNDCQMTAVHEERTIP